MHNFTIKNCNKKIAAHTALYQFVDSMHMGSSEKNEIFKAVFTTINS